MKKPSFLQHPQEAGEYDESLQEAEEGGGYPQADLLVNEQEPLALDTLLQDPPHPHYQQPNHTLTPQQHAFYAQLHASQSSTGTHRERDPSLDTVKFWDDKWFNLERRRYPDPLPPDAVTVPAFYRKHVRVRSGGGDASRGADESLAAGGQEQVPELQFGPDMSMFTNYPGTQDPFSQEEEEGEVGRDMVEPSQQSESHRGQQQQQHHHQGEEPYGELQHRQSGGIIVTSFEIPNTPPSNSGTVGATAQGRASRLPSIARSSSMSPPRRSNNNVSASKVSNHQSHIGNVSRSPGAHRSPYSRHDIPGPPSDAASDNGGGPFSSPAAPFYNADASRFNSPSISNTGSIGVHGSVGRAGTSTYPNSNTGRPEVPRRTPSVQFSPDHSNSPSHAVKTIRYPSRTTTTTFRSDPSMVSRTSGISAQRSISPSASVSTRPSFVNVMSSHVSQPVTCPPYPQGIMRRGASNLPDGSGVGRASSSISIVASTGLGIKPPSRQYAVSHSSSVNQAAPQSTILQRSESAASDYSSFRQGSVLLERGQPFSLQMVREESSMTSRRSKANSPAMMMSGGAQATGAFIRSFSGKQGHENQQQAQSVRDIMTTEDNKNSLPTNGSNNPAVSRKSSFVNPSMSRQPSMVQPSSPLRQSSVHFDPKPQSDTLYELAEKMSVADLSIAQAEYLDPQHYDVTGNSLDGADFPSSATPVNGLKNVLAALQEHSKTISSLQNTLDDTNQAKAAVDAANSVTLPNLSDPLSKLHALQSAISSEAMLRNKASPGVNLDALIELKVFEQMQQLKQDPPIPSASPVPPASPTFSAKYDVHANRSAISVAGDQSFDGQQSNFNTLDASILERLNSPDQEQGDVSYITSSLEPDARLGKPTPYINPVASEKRKINPKVLDAIQQKLVELESSLMAAAVSSSAEHPPPTISTVTGESNDGVKVSKYQDPKILGRVMELTGVIKALEGRAKALEANQSITSPSSGQVPQSKAKSSFSYDKNSILEERVSLIEAQLERLGQHVSFLQECWNRQEKSTASSTPTQEQIQAMIHVALHEEMKPIKAAIKGKVDSGVLEELVRHIPTRPEVAKLVKSKIKDIDGLRARVENGFDEIIGKLEKLALYDSQPVVAQALTSQDMKTVQAMIDRAASESRDFIMNDVDLKLVRARREMNGSCSPSKHSSSPVRGGMVGAAEGSTVPELALDELKKELKVWVGKRLGGVMTENTTWMNARVEGLKEELNVEFATEIKRLQQKPMDHAELAEQDLELLSKELSRRFDEKLFLLSSELSMVKTAYHRAAGMPFFKIGQWIWRSGVLKLGSAVPWNLQSRNTDEDNFIWEQDSVNIRIAEAGLYEISFAFFTKAKPSIQLVVNGESVLSAINSPSYVVHHSSGFVTDGNGRMEEGTTTGISLLDFLALPPKSTLSLHYHGGKKGSLGHGFLGLRRL